MNELDATAAFAGVEKLFILSTFPAAYSTGVGLFQLSLLSLMVGLVGRIVHEIWKWRRATERFASCVVVHDFLSTVFGVVDESIIISIWGELGWYHGRKAVMQQIRRGRCMKKMEIHLCLQLQKRLI